MSAPALRDFQRRFAHALLAQDPAREVPEAAALARQPGFAVYRNTVMKGLVDALAAGYPAVLRLVGEEWFRAAATVYARANPPREPMLVTYGATFPEFLAGFAPAADLPWLAAVARLDRFFIEAHVAPDAPALDPASLAALAPDALARTVLALHPSARWAWSAEAPVHSLWARSRAGADDLSDVAWHAEGTLIVRPRAAVEWRPLDAAGCAFLDACASGAALADAATAALDADGDVDIAALLATLLGAGAFRAPADRSGRTPWRTP